MTTPIIESLRKPGELTGHETVVASLAELSYSSAQRAKLAKDGHALADGSFPIANLSDLRKAIHSYGRAENKTAVRAHIVRHARAFGRHDLIPPSWFRDDDLVDAFTGLALKGGRLTVAAEDAITDLDLEPEFAYSPNERKSMARAGHALPDGSYPIKNPADLKRAVKAYGRGGNKTQVKRHIVKRARGLGRSDLIPSSWPEAPKNKKAATTAPVVEAELAAGEPQEQTTAGVEQGARFRIPLVIPEGVESGDGRTFAANSLTSRQMPLALLWQRASGQGHEGSVVVGRIDHVERVNSPYNGLGNAYGMFDAGPEGQEAERLVRSGMLRGVSADLDEFEAKMLDAPEETSTDEIASARILVNKGRLMAVTLVPKPAFEGCYIEIDPSKEEQGSQEVEEQVPAEVVTASAGPLFPPAGWFENPNFIRPTPLTVDDSGHVSGHVALWDTDHVGLPFGTRPPRSATGYAYFQTGVVRTADGTDVPVGQLTLAGGHAPLSATASEAVRHYDDTKSAVADVCVGEDRHGIWVAGAVRPDVTPDQVRALRASSPSGDWRPIKGHLELVAVCQVNVPGFPVARARVASGQVQALVAAGAMPLALMKDRLSDPGHLLDRIDALELAERARVLSRADAQRARVQPLIDAKVASARSRIESVRAPIREAAAAQRDRVTKHREAHTASAAQDGDRGDDDDKSERARELALDLHVTPGAKWDEAQHPRGEHGHFREVLARIADELKNVPEASHGAAQLRAASDAAAHGDEEAARSTATAAADSLASAVHDATGDGKQAIGDALATLRDATPQMSGSVAYGDLPKPIQEFLDGLVQQGVDRLNPLDKAENSLKHYVDGNVYANPNDIANLIARNMRQPLIPNAIDMPT